MATSHRPPSKRGDLQAPLVLPGLPTPRFAAAWAALVYALATMALGFPALAGQFLINPRSDQYIAGYAFREFAAAHLRSGLGFPQWNPFLFGGMPYVAAMHGDIFYPTFLLRMIMPTDMAMTWEFIIHLFLAGCFTYGFLRAWGMGFFPSLVGGLAYLLSGWIASYASPGHDGKLFVSTLFPLALWFLVRGIRDGRDWAWGALALVFGLAVLAPHPQLLQYLLLGCGAFSLYLAFGSADTGQRLPRDVALRRLGLALAAVSVGALIGSVQFLPVREYVAYSPRAGGRGYEFATTYSFPLEELINTYLPQFSGILDRYWGRNGIHLHSEYIGAVVLLLAGAAFGRTTRRGFRWFWAGTFLVTLVWALGGSTPLYQIIYAIVPGTKYFRAPSTIFFITTFSVAVFAALGTERLLAGWVTERYAIGWIVAGGIIAILASVGGLTNMAQVIAAGIAPGRDDLVAENAGALFVGAWRSFLFVLLAAGVVFALARGRMKPGAAAWALVVLAAVDLWSIERMYWQFSEPASVLFAPDSASRYLRTAAPGRVITSPLSDANLAFHDPFMFGDGLMVERARLLLGYHGNEMGRYQKLFGKVPDMSDYNMGLIFNPQTWRHENVRYLYTNADEQSVNGLFSRAGVPSATRLVGPVKNAAGSTVYLYRLAGDNPPAWLAPVMVKAPDEQALGTVMDQRFDQTRVAIVDTSATNVRTQQITALPAALTAHANVTRYEPEHISVQLDAAPPEGAALVVAENYYPGWTATANGRPAPVTRTDYNLIGIQLPAGTTRVDLAFADPAYGTGKTITLLALLLAAIGLVVGIVTDRREREPADATPAPPRRGSSGAARSATTAGTGAGARNG